MPKNLLSRFLRRLSRSGTKASAEYVDFEVSGARFTARSTDYIYTSAAATGYEPWVCTPLLEALSPGMTFMDVGANVGVFTVLGARRVGPEGRVFAIEPMQENCRLIHRNVTANHLRNVQIIPSGASERVGSAVARFDPYGSNAEITRSSDANDPNLTIIATIPLDALSDQLDRLDVIKFDIEGHEYRALLGARELLQRFRPIVFTEYSPVFQRNGSGVDGPVYLDALLDLDYIPKILLRRGEVVDLEGMDRAGILGSIERYWRDHTEWEGGTHLDLMLTPAR